MDNYGEWDKKHVGQTVVDPQNVPDAIAHAFAGDGTNPSVEKDGRAFNHTVSMPYAQFHKTEKKTPKFHFFMNNRGYGYPY